MQEDRHIVSMPATLESLTPEEETRLFAAQPEVRRDAMPRPAGSSRRPSSSPPKNVVVRQASLESAPLDESIVSDATLKALDEGGALTFADGRVYIRTAEGNLLVESFAEAFPKTPAPSRDAAALQAASPRGKNPAEEAPPAFCDLEGPQLADALKTWPGGQILALRGEGLCSLSAPSRDPVAVSRLIAEVSLSSLGGSRGSAGKYRSLVELYAAQYALAPSLVLAIMHTESNFNPSAVSPSSALGLMQVVPATAGHEVSRYLKGGQDIPSTEALLSPENNIKYGTVYLHLLARRYFGDVINPDAREMCIIAAYNGGPGAVLRVFDQDKDVAVATINGMTPEEVYETLTTKMPNAETRRYVEVVMGHQRTYTQ